MSQKTLNLCLERYNFVKFGETTKSSHTVLCINNAYSVNSDKYRLTPAAIASKHGDGYVFTLNYDFDRPLFTIAQKSYSLDGTSGNIVFEGIDPISKGGSKYLRKVTVSPVKLLDGSYLLEVTNDEYLRIGTTGAALGDEDLKSLNEKIVATGGISKSVETVGGKQVLRLDAGGPSGAKEIVYFDVDPSNPPSGIYDNITVALSNDKEPVIRIDGAVYFYTSTGTDKYVFVGDYTKEAVGYTEIEVSDDDSMTSKSVDDKAFNMFLLYKTDPASPGDPPGNEDSWVCDANKHVITKDELVAAHTDCRYFILNNDVDPDSNSRKYFAAVTNVSNPYVQLRFYMVEYSGEGAANFYQKTVSNDSEGRLYISDSYQTYLAGTSQAVLVSEPQSFNATQKAQGRDNIGAASASDVTALQSQVSSLSDVSAYSVKGEATIAQLNAGPSGIQAGWAYQLTDSGTLTDGTLAVVAGDTVAWDGTKWFPLVKSDYYATKTYAQNVAHSIAPEFDPTKPNDAGGYAYYAGTPVMYDGSCYVFTSNKQSGAWDLAVVEKKPLSESIRLEGVGEAVNEWLNEHPEATTTVQDESLIERKFSDSLRLKTIKDYVTPEMFGAIADANYVYDGKFYADSEHTILSTDNTQAFTDALASGKPLLIGSGRYFFADKLSITSADTVIFSLTNGELFFDEGLDSALEISASRLFLINFTVATFVRETRCKMIDIKATSNSRFDKIRTRYGGYGFHCGNSEHIYLSDFYGCFATYHASAAFYFSRSSANDMNNSLTFLNCQASRSALGMYLAGKSLNVIGCCIETNTSGGIELGLESRSVRIVGNYFEINENFNIKINKFTYDTTIGANFFNESEKKIVNLDYYERGDFHSVYDPLIQPACNVSRAFGISISNLWRLAGTKLPCTVNLIKTIEYNQTFILGIVYKNRAWGIFPAKAGEFFKAKITAIDGNTVTLDAEVDDDYTTLIGVGSLNPFKELADAGLNLVAVAQEIDWMRVLEQNTSSGATTVNLGSYASIWRVSVGDYIFFGKARRVFLGSIRLYSDTLSLTVPEGYEWVEEPVICPVNEAREYDVSFVAKTTI